MNEMKYWVAIGQGDGYGEFAFYPKTSKESEEECNMFFGTRDEVAQKVKNLKYLGTSALIMSTSGEKFHLFLHLKERTVREMEWRDRHDKQGKWVGSSHVLLREYRESPGFSGRDEDPCPLKEENDAWKIKLALDQRARRNK